jgi:hypothetical protein
VADPAAAAEIRKCCGRPPFEHGNPAMGVILAAQPHRVFVSRIGRAEVFQPIPPPDGKSPEGPHTHVLPKLLRNGLTHAATEPVPEGLVPCAHFYPSHPSKDAMGVARAYDPALDAAFQKLFGAYGDPALVSLKAQMIKAITAGEDPSGFTVPSHRFARATIRVGLRQLAAAGATGSLPRWQALHDRHHHHDESEAEAGGPHGH